MLKYQASEDLDNKESPENSVTPSDKIEQAKENLLALISEEYKITKEYIKTQKVTNTSNLISKLEPSAPTEILL